MIASVKNLSFSYGQNQIFSGADLLVNEGEKVGLVGPNGVGKTTLINLLSGDLSPDEGEISLKNGAAIGFLDRDWGDGSQGTVYEEMKAVFKRDFELMERAETLARDLSALDAGSNEYRDALAKMDAVNREIASRESFDADVKIKTVLNGMGFFDMYDRAVDTLSGGEKTRLKIAKLLLEEPDMLVLDEPTNHLDISCVFWLEERLKNFKGALLVSSHDRYFLDAVCSKIADIDDKKIVTYQGNYSSFKVQKEARYASLMREYEKSVAEAARLKEYVDKNRARASTAKSAKSKEKKLERMGEIKKPVYTNSRVRYDFKAEFKSYEKVLSCKGLKLSIGDKTLISSGGFELSRGDRLALVGENGVGKTVLLKSIYEERNPFVETGQNVSMGMYRQEWDNLGPEETALMEIWKRHAYMPQTELRALLARGGLFAEDMEKRVKDLSGGEKAKLALCVLELENANLLILDEPTNYLDLDARECLEEALLAFDGTILFVSHDRYFLGRLATKVMEIEDTVLTQYDCPYEEYLEKKRETNGPGESAAGKVAPERKAQGSYRSKEERANAAKTRDKISSLERDIADLERREKELEASLALPEIYSDYKKAGEACSELEDVRKRMESLYEEYSKLI